ncbi:ATP-binding cassette, subfamily C, exporter for protease/lipase [Methylophilus rhizosphaerae]|uniref:ATP-binding cassette, subfamily C, exporter for protease/lipase n=1 Tax=Methylophilus rhizosphaerae TaxID=492660 RepID=A0A1G8ZHC4_9PROT|nr:type I secretion system permease/ATPase [Methylophilus rhizosphaerae]SDK13994.1 ATP-binding cassette, subfamily C, exporter for protease/lipase [Methylophilus rhizosphaerae]
MFESLLSMLSQSESIKQVMSELWPAWHKVWMFGVVTHLLILVPSWYMLEVYDRVINSRNASTLLMLTLLAVFAYLVMEAMEWQRRLLLQANAHRFEQLLQERLFDRVFAARLSMPDFPAPQVFSDFSTLKSTLHSSALLSLLDAPFCLIFLGAVFWIHPALGVLTLVGLLIQLALTVQNQARVTPLMKLANEQAMESQRYFASISRHGDVMHAMQMLAPVEQRWLQSQHGFLWQQTKASELAGRSAAVSRWLQTMQTSLILGLGCYLFINGELVQGGAMMIVASILAGRVLAPLVQCVGHWKTYEQAWTAFRRIDSLFAGAVKKTDGLVLPPPTGEVRVEQLAYAIPQAGKTQSEVFIRQVQFTLPAGHVLVVAGASASGKTTLAKLLVGLLVPSSGRVRYDGVDVYGWDKVKLGPHIGYLAQEVDLFDGKLIDNLCRFKTPDSQALAEVIDLLGLADWIQQLPDGLETRIGQGGIPLSGGERQLIGLARAFYGKPRIVVLDEPNANLDTGTERTLQLAIARLKQQGTTFIIISHLQHVLAIADAMLVMRQGQMIRYGKPAEVLASFQQEAGKVARP